ncbi:MAG: TetR/AcrR family transcriptional regulator [Verrucomicrobiota bacterium]
MTTVTAEILETKDRIMDVAERLFAEDGFKATSLRSITQEAEANLAAVNYHFGTKDNLIIEVIRRKLSLINNERISRLSELQESGTPSVEEILDSFFRPAFEYFQDASQVHFLRLLGRTLHESGDFLHQLMVTDWIPLADAYIEALSRAIPEVSREDILWRFHFTMGAMIFTVSKMDMLEESSCGECQINGDFEPAIQKLIQYTSAGFKN